MEEDDGFGWHSSNRLELKSSRHRVSRTILLYVGAVGGKKEGGGGMDCLRYCLCVCVLKKLEGC